MRQLRGSVKMRILRVKREIEESLREALRSCDLSLRSLPVVELISPREASHGDYTANLPFLLSQEVNLQPPEIGELILKVLSCDSRVVDRVELGGGGFLNFILSKGFLLDELREILGDGDNYGKSEGRGEKVLVEYVSANPTGPLVVANARAAAVGDSIVKILNFSGFQADSEYYVDDSGHQVELLGESLGARYREVLGEEAQFPEGGYRGEYLKEMAEELISQGLKEPGIEVFKKYALERIVEGQRETLSRFGVDFDHWSYESSFRDSGKGNEVIEELRKRGHTYEKDGALWFKTTDFEDEKDRVLVKSDGELTYLVPDAAYHADKFKRGYDRLIDLLGPDHHGHIPRLRAAISALGYPLEKLRVLIVQWVTFYRGAEKVGMSKRGGEFVTMDELIDEVGVDAARFFFLMRKSSAHLDFDLKLAKSESEENPVYYVQYAHARVCSILKFAEEQGVRRPPLEEVNLDLLKEEEELRLLRKLIGFPELVENCGESLEPHRIPFYLSELATLFHNFYQKHRVVTDDLSLSQARLTVVEGVRQIIRNGLSLIGVSAPESM